MPLNWGNIADACGLQFRGKPWLYGTMRGTLNNVEVYAAVEQRRDLETELYSGRATIEAAYRFGHGPEFRLLREGTGRAWLKRFGYQDIQIGHHEVDFSCIVKGKRESMIRSVLLESADDLARLTKIRAVDLPFADEQAIHTELQLSEGNPEHIDGFVLAVQTLARMAATDLVGYSTLKALPDGVEGSEGGLPSVVLPLPNRVEFTPEYENERYTSRARARNACNLSPLIAAAHEGATIANATGISVASSALVALGDATLAIDETWMAVEWPCVVTDVDTLMAGAHLLSQLSQPPQGGIYR